MIKMTVLPLLKIDNLDHSFSENDQSLDVLKSVSLTLQPAEFIILAGPSGCGKTTLLSLVGGLRSVQRGSIKVCGDELLGISGLALNRVRRHIGMIFQSHHLVSFLTAEENIILAMDAPSRQLHSMASKRKAARRLLEQMELIDKADVMIGQLSGGQRQRVSIARALACDPKLILADEPTASLDVRNGRRIMMRLQSLAKDNGIGVLMTSHDQRLYSYADRIVAIDDGHIVHY